MARTPSPDQWLVGVMLAVCIAWLGSSGSAGAQAIPDETPRAVLFVHPQNADAEAASARLFMRLSETLAGSRKFQAVPLIDLVGSNAPSPAVPPGVRKQFELARRAYDNLELTRAIKLLERAIEALESNLANGLDLELYTEVSIYLGASQVLVGKRAMGRKVFRKLLGINPDAEINAMIFPPSLVSAFREEGEALSAAPQGALDLRSKPAGAAIWVDGRERGSTPRSLPGLTPGVHLVHMERMGYQSAGAAVGVPAAGQKTYAPTLIALSGAERLRFLASRLSTAVSKERYPGAVDEALRWAKADRLFFFVIQSSAESVQIQAYHFDGLASERLRARQVELSTDVPDFDARARAFFKSLYEDRVADLPAGLAWVDLDPEPTGLPDPGPTDPADGDPDSGSGVLGSWWLWTVVGVVVVGGAGVALGLTLGKNEQANAGDVIFRF